LVLAFLGQVIRASTIGLEYIVRGGRNHRVYADSLVTEGLFRHTRNPMYVGKFFMVLGAGVAANRWPAMLGISAAYTFMYSAVIRAEEAYLREKFGPVFDEYVRHVPRWLPRLRGLTQTLSESRFNWPRVLLKEYSAPLGWALPIVLIGIYNLRQAPGADGHPYATASLLSVLSLVLLFWVVVGWLKKSGSPALRLTDK
jgi:hypothetical protein